MSEIIYRKAELSDINSLIRLRTLQMLEEGAMPALNINYTLRDFYNRHIKDGTFVSWIATVDNEIIATSGMSFAEKPPYYGNLTGRIGILSSMYTNPEYRRQGIAKKLLGLVIDEAREYGCAVVHLTASNKGVPLYEDFGFERNGNFFQYKIPLDDLN